ncbi:MAG: gliding motility-associated ABC transporter permease subunit GldF [Crocinitomicaceae bacterium]|nr:gliding motility-associated ABC transporter permease subunit GldF [Crocinitomicaceae bacterium]|tara:strand:- start:10972 stop:11712 length:741 start_codon:yes stop_codon:yes gene_type:complete
MRSLYLREIKGFLSSIIGYVFILIYLISSGIMHWIAPTEANLLEGTEADLIPFFNSSPIIFLILIPAITMRSIAEERRTGTIELLFTRPISDLKILLAKYFASVTLMLIAILPTLIYYYSMIQLSEDPSKFDHGATITSYIGLILLGSCFVAIGIFTSALTNSQIVAFILALFFCWIFVPNIGGIALLGSYNLMGSFDSIVQYFGMTFHYEGIKKGVIDTKNIIYFLSLIYGFIYAALTVIKSTKK